ncbi:MAG: HAMP domain-containing sensor histidine kinase [Terriglobales bacterium]
MRLPRSLTWRLVAGVVLAELVLAVGLVWAGTIFTRRQLRQAFDAGLHGRLMSVAALVRYPETGVGLVFDPTLLPPARNRRHPVFFAVLGPGGKAVTANFPVGVPQPAPRADGRPRYWRFRFAGAPYRGLVLADLPVLDTEEGLRTAHAHLTVYYAAPMLDLGEEVGAAAAAIALTSLVLLVLSTLLAVWMIRRELHPLRELAQHAQGISTRNWRFVPGPGAASRPELQPLIEALERMLHRLHAAHEQQRTFLADAAHHLKTPVAILKSTLQSLLQRPRSAEEYRAAVQASLGDVERLEGLLQRMLRLARLEHWAEDERVRQLPAVALGATCAAALDRVRPLAQARDLELRCTGLEREAWVQAEADDLELVWVNLLENAVQHSPEGSRVALDLNRNPSGALTVAVQDQGPGISADEAPFVFERFRRGLGGPAGGYGLGLAIARSIVQAYGGEIVLVPAAGARFLVTLPAATDMAPVAASVIPS